MRGEERDIIGEELTKDWRRLTKFRLEKLGRTVPAWFRPPQKRRILGGSIRPLVTLVTLVSGNEPPQVE